ncbi:MAG: VWA containing CoxE family protein [Chrysiogenetes bacterium]|nr:VWA containing CoxE family protein [Chrysiogenetes bacterium]
MLEPFFYMLKGMGLPVTPTEWMTLHEALEKDLADSSLLDFYYLSRGLLVKTEQHYDIFDRAFGEFFSRFETSEEMLATILAGMKAPDEELNLSPEELAKLKKLNLSELRARFEEKYRTGHYDEHVGGNKQIGTGGRSPTGEMGDNPQGLRVGENEQGRHRRAIQVATKRRFEDLSGGRVLDTRQIQAALRRLKVMVAEGPEDQLSLEKSIDASARGGGDIELVFEAERRNRVKVILFLDAGGSMWPHAKMADLLFSAARGLFKQVDHYYFHNCVYQQVWKSFDKNERIDTAQILNEADPKSKVLFVGDAAMALSELLAVDGSIDYFQRNDLPGIKWLSKIHEQFPSSVWLNPEPQRAWNMTDSTRYIQRVFPMFPLTLEGMEEAAKFLVTGKKH